MHDDNVRTLQRLYKRLQILSGRICIQASTRKNLNKLDIAGKLKDNTGMMKYPYHRLALVIILIKQLTEGLIKDTERQKVLSLPSLRIDSFPDLMEKFKSKKSGLLLRKLNQRLRNVINKVLPKKTY